MSARASIPCVLAAIAMAGGCGRIGFGDATRGDDGGVTIDAAGDAPPDAPCTFGAFAAPTTDAVLNSPGTDWGPTLTPDGLTLVFASDRDGTQSIFASSRASLTSEWSTPVQQFQMAAEIDGGDPFISPDGMTLYWSGTGGLQQAPVVTPLTTWGAGFVAVGPSAAVGNPSGIDVSADGLHAEFSGQITGSDGDFHMFEATRATTDVPFGASTQLPGISNAGGESFGSETDDQLSVIYEVGDVTYELWIATRATTADAFGNEAEITEFDVAGADQVDPDISYDGKTIVFASDRDSGDYDLWFSTRACQ